MSNDVLRCYCWMHFMSDYVTLQSVRSRKYATKNNTFKSFMQNTLSQSHAIAQTPCVYYEYEIQKSPDLYDRKQINLCSEAVSLILSHSLSLWFQSAVTCQNYIYYKNINMISFFAKCSQDDAFKVLCSSEPFPSSSTGSEPVDNRPTQEGKPTSQESASTSDLI